MTIKAALQWANEQLVLNSASARLDAEVLLSHILKRPTTFLLSHSEDELGFFQLWRFTKFVLKRKAGVPIAYLTGHKEFFMLDFKVNKHVLVPRPDTEILVEAVIDYLRAVSDERRATSLLLDVGTGSACIPVSILKDVPGLNAVATDISRPALRVAKENIAKHGLKSRIKLLRSDLLKDVPRSLLSDRDVVVTANLPYLPDRMIEVNPELKYEPHVALFGGVDGVILYERLIDQLLKIRPKAIFFELFEEQIALIQQQLADYELRFSKPMTGNARLLFLERRRYPER